MRAFDDHQDFKALLLADADVTSVLPPAEIERAFDLDEQLRNVDSIIDRVFRAGRYWVPHWYLAAHRISYWDVFGRPSRQPKYFRGIPLTWWHDKDKAAKL